MSALIRALPDVARLVARLAIDPRLPRRAKIALVAAAIYLASPLDFLPDTIPLFGYLDDLLIVSVVLDRIFNCVDRQLLLRYWPGTAESLDRLGRVAALFARWLPRRIKRRVFATG